MSTDFRALCAELAEELVEEYGYCTEWEKGLPLCESNVSELLNRVRAELAKPEPVAPTLDCDEIAVPVWHRGDDFHLYKEGYTAGWAAAAKAVADRYSRHTIQPAPENADG
jgi:hypothetical protein